MKVIYGIGKLKSKRLPNPVVTLGVFDGVHRGHLRLLSSTLKKARILKGVSVVVTFYPHPQSELSLYSLEHRLRLFRKLKLDLCVVVKFNKSLSGISPHRFVKDLLVKMIHPAYVIVGENFRFGKGAAGTAAILKEFSRKYGFRLKVLSVSRFKGRPISSSYIRRLIRQGELRLAERLLGRPVSLLGEVRKGFRIGRGLGFPTANLMPNHEVLPAPGVYLARALIKKKIWAGICYIGTKPTFFKRRKNAEIFVEIHIFRFRTKIYGDKIEVQFLKKLRGQRKFRSPEQLQAQIRKDVRIARQASKRIKSLSNMPQYIRF